ncbi:MAG: helix-turn-helix transcriptional regulator [Holdemanella sp.]|nr:helix-turn-helix transcriptional regulator [Holdemanella sp.]
MKIGNRIKELRLKNNLTLEELASRSELTKGFLSQLERDLTSPNISTLEDILEALGTNLSEFFQSEPEEKIVFKASDFFENEQESYKVEWIVPNAQKNKMEPILLTLYSGMDSKELSGHTGDEFGYVLRGSIELVIGNKKYKVKAKETFYLSGPESHYIHNSGNSDAKVLWITTPPLF